MGRKNLLSGLLPPTSEAPPEAAAPVPAAPVRMRAGRGAIGAVSQSLAELRARAVLDLDPWSIEAGGLPDRLESDPEDDAALARSIAEYGQQVPVLVRPHPEKDGRYQVVYGRRRVLAARDLGRMVKALVRELDDPALVMAQGQENSTRRDLSFIEKAHFAWQMLEAGFDRKAIGDALSVDKTVVSRMLAVMERVPLDLIRFIGSAVSAGRDRWMLVGERIAAAGHDVDHLKAMIVAMAKDNSSDERFEALFAYLDKPFRPRAPDPVAPRVIRRPTRPLRSAEGGRLGAARTSDTAVVLRLDRAKTQGFEDWLLDHLAELHRDWLSQRGRC